MSRRERGGRDGKRPQKPAWQPRCSWQARQRTCGHLLALRRQRRAVDRGCRCLAAAAAVAAAAAAAAAGAGAAVAAGEADAEAYSQCDGGYRGKASQQEALLAACCAAQHRRASGGGVDGGLHAAGRADGGSSRRQPVAGGGTQQRAASGATQRVCPGCYHRVLRPSAALVQRARPVSAVPGQGATTTGGRTHLRGTGALLGSKLSGVKPGSGDIRPSSLPQPSWLAHPSWAANGTPFFCPFIACVVWCGLLKQAGRGTWAVVFEPRLSWRARRARRPGISCAMARQVCRL